MYAQQCKLESKLMMCIQGLWMPEGDSVKIPVAIKTIQDRTGRQTFHDITDVRGTTMILNLPKSMHASDTHTHTTKSAGLKMSD